MTGVLKQAPYGLHIRVGRWYSGWRHPTLGRTTRPAISRAIFSWTFFHGPFFFPMPYVLHLTCRSPPRLRADNAGAARRGSPATRRSTPRETGSARGRTAPSGSSNAATRRTGSRARPTWRRRSNRCRERIVSESKCDKAGTNHHQAHNDNGKETGRSNIFAHDDTYASIRQRSLNHQFVSGCLRRTQKTTSLDGSTVTCRTPHEVSSRQREPGGHGGRPPSFRPARRISGMWCASHVACRARDYGGALPVGHWPIRSRTLRTEEH